MSGKIKVIVKRPDEMYGHVTYMSNTLKAFQTAVGGNIETVTLVSAEERRTIMICNEEGKILNLEKNFKFGTVLPDVIKGTVVICGVDGEEFADVPITFESWKMLLHTWGNE